MEITVELIDDIMSNTWDDDEGEFIINENITGQYMLIDCTYKGDDNDQYFFLIKIRYLKEDVSESFLYIINNLGRENTLKKLGAGGDESICKS